jgi:GNAT superfamily N-acetyltransferase
LGEASPDQETYLGIEGVGLAQCFSVRLDGALCGFAVLLLAPLPHYGGRLCATVESIFVSAVAREMGLGVQLMRAVDRYAAHEECAAIFYTAPVNSRLAKLLFLCSDEYTHTNHVFTKRLL